ncbi:hypothetical protein ACFPMF_05540 [Larkinella bovis]|uniref:XRE family transcriptional regulator n=1 Tax=Larkinella bovis TaxID=683041 RepID=A0ABW0I5W1_9BACT
MQTVDDKLQRCRTLIEAKVNWGDSSQWQNQDFETLSERILAETGVSLSVSTLKRIWGKVRYQSEPTVTTLNTLARFIGYENWRVFQNQTTGEPTEPAPVLSPEQPGPTPAISPASKYWPWAIALLLLAGLVGIWAFQNRVEPLQYGELAFTSRPVARGLPNTVLFDYDATDSNADSVFIQQSWDPRRRYRVAKDGHQYTSTYYYPGYFRAKLVLNDSIVKEHDVYITTDGWLGTINDDSIPTYFPDRQIRKKDQIALTETDLIAQGVDFQKTIPEVSLQYVQPLGELSASHFVFETELQSTFNRSNAVCQHARIMLLCSNGMHSIPLSVKGCVGQLYLSLADQSVSGKTTDLSGFGVDFSDWVKVRCEVNQKKARIFVNGNLAYTGDFQEDPGKIVGLRYFFHGTGSVKSARFSDGKNETVLR